MKTVHLEVIRETFSPTPRIEVVVREGCCFCGETQRTHHLSVDVPEIVGPHELAGILRQMAEMLDRE